MFGSGLEFMEIPALGKFEDYFLCHRSFNDYLVFLGHLNYSYFVAFVLLKYLSLSVLR